MMIYFGQEFGEPGMDSEGFSGRDGRTTIFDYWSIAVSYTHLIYNVMQYIYKYQSPIGGITIASDGSSLTGLWFDGQKYFACLLYTSSTKS